MRFVGIDPSTKTGVVILDKLGNVIDAMEVTAAGEYPGRMVDIRDGVADQIERSDYIAIEGFSYGSKGRAVDIQYGIGWGIRMALYDQDQSYIQVAPAALKKFAGAKGNAKKDELAVHIFKRWGYEHQSDNVRDAYVLAQIARAAYLKGQAAVDMKAFQADVIKTIMEPKKAVKK